AAARRVRLPRLPRRRLRRLMRARTGRGAAPNPGPAQQLDADAEAHLRPAAAAADRTGPQPTHLPQPARLRPAHHPRRDADAGAPRESHRVADARLTGSPGHVDQDAVAEGVGAEFFVARALDGGYAVAVWCRGLAGYPASRAAQRRPSVLQSIRHGERCFRLAGRRNCGSFSSGLGQPRPPPFYWKTSAVAAARPRALPLPGADGDAPDHS